MSKKRKKSRKPKAAFPDGVTLHWNPIMVRKDDTNALGECVVQFWPPLPKRENA